jgi:hypothetical protein
MVDWPLRYKRKIAEIDEGEIANYGSSDGGTTWYPMAVDSNGVLQTSAISGLVTVTYDTILMSFTGDNMTEVFYKTGGLSGTTVATLTLAYTGARLDSVVRT